MAPDAPALLGVSARFDAPDALADAVRAARRDGFDRLETFTPFPVAEINDLLMESDPVIPWATFLSAVFGAAAGLWLGWFINVWDFPINIGGRPLAAWPAFVLPAFELAVLFGTLGAMGSMLARNGLPRLHHPIFEAREFHRATDDGFFLLIRCESPDAARRLLAEAGGKDIDEVRQQWAA